MPPLNGVKVKLGGETRVLRYTNRSLVALEMQSGCTMAELAGNLARGSFKTVAELVWAGLLHADPRLTVDAVVEMIDLREIAALGDGVRQAMDMALGPEQPESSEGKAPAVA